MCGLYKAKLLARLSCHTLCSAKICLWLLLLAEGGNQWDWGTELRFQPEQGGCAVGSLEKVH